jgi:hypothetical protein
MRCLGGFVATSMSNMLVSQRHHANYAHRLREMYPDSPWNNLRLFLLNPVDVALAKLERNLDLGREDLLGLAAAGYIDASVLKTRDFEECGLISRVTLNGTIELSIYG